MMLGSTHLRDSSSTDGDFIELFKDLFKRALENTLDDSFGMFE